MDRGDGNISRIKEIELPSQLQELLPCGYSYKLKKWILFENKPDHFEAVILTNVYTEEEAQEWWHEFNVKSNTTMRVRATCPKTGKVNTFKIYLRCLHQGRAEKEKPERHQKTKSASPAKRNTNCPAGMVVAIRRLIKYSRSKMRDPVDPVHPCEIQIRFVHNHPTNSVDSLRFRPVSKEAEEKLLNLFQIGHSPTSALETLKIDLQIEHGTMYSQIISDRYHCPDKSFCYRLFYKHFGKDYAAFGKKDMYTVLNDKISHYNTMLGETCVTAGMSGTHYVIAVCTPLMKRLHSLPQSGDLVYVELCESPGSKERAEHYVLLLLAHTAAGGIPLGALIATNNNTAVLALGFELLKQLLPDHAFCGRGIIGPHAFLTEDSETQRLALNTVWSESAVIICIFRILQSMWRWLWDEKHNILKDHRLYLLYLLKTLLFASNEEEMGNKYQALCADNIIVHYPLYLQHVESLWQRRHFWGICFHRLLPLQGASNYYEAAVRALKDKTFEQTKAFNIVQLLNYAVTRIDSYYKTKLLDIVGGKVIHIFRSFYPTTIPSDIEPGIKQIAGNYFIVPSDQGDDKVYTVDAELNMCSCPNGINGALCIHQFWIFLKMSSDMFKVSYFGLEFKQKLISVVTGSDSSFDFTSHTPAELQANVSSDIQSDETLSIVSTVFTETNSRSVSESSSSTSVLSIFKNRDKNIPTTPINNSHQAPICSLISTITPVSQIIAESAIPESKNTLENVTLNSVDGRNQQRLLAIVTDNSLEHDLNIPENEVNEETNKRMEDVLEKFENFCQRVKDGVKNQTKDFLPALEIMMKNLERKGNSTDIIISGLSFFGVFSVPSLLSKTRKRSSPCAAFAEEIVPKVHGRQMITYGRKRSLLSAVENKSTAESGFSSSLIDSSTPLNEIVFNISSENG